MAWYRKWVPLSNNTDSEALMPYWFKCERYPSLVVSRPMMLLSHSLESTLYDGMGNAFIQFLVFASKSKKGIFRFLHLLCPGEKTGFCFV